MIVLVPYLARNEEVDGSIGAAMVAHRMAMPAKTPPPVVERVDVSGPLEKYWETLAEFWKRCLREDKALTIVEDDVAIHSSVLLSFARCTKPWCAFPYRHRNDELAPALGCTRFSAELIAAEPDLLDWIGTWSQLGSPIEDHSRPRIWQVLDARIHRALTDGPLRAEHGRTGAPYEWHVHEPEVRHLMLDRQEPRRPQYPFGRPAPA